MSEEKKNQKIPCEICGKEVARVKLKTHLLYHEKRFNCAKCDIKFEVRRPWIRIRHILSFGIKSAFKCNRIYKCKAVNLSTMFLII